MLKNTCFALSNIAAGTEDQIQKLIVANIFPKLVKVFNGKRGGKRVQIEIFHVSGLLIYKLLISFYCFQIVLDHQ